MSQLGYKSIGGDSVKTLAKVKANANDNASLVHKSRHLFIEGNQVSQALFTLDKPMLAVPDHLLPLDVPRNVLP